MSLKAPSLLRAVTLCLATLCPYAAHAQQVMLDEEFTRDATILTAPLRSSLAPQISVHFVLINDPTINAFVTPENIVYVHTGLIAKANSAAELQGVLAHELGHVAAQHLFQQEVQQRQAAMGAIAGAVVGLGAAVAGAPQAGTALMMGSQAGAIQSILAHTRTQESEADRHAVNALHTAGLSAQGMVEMFTTLRTESQLSYDAPPPWLVTHPLPPDRLANLQQVVSAEAPALRTGLLKTDQSIDYPRLQAKVAALTGTIGSILRKYNGADDVSRYARALAYARQGKMDFAVSNLNPLLKAHPDDPFYNELAAKMALDRGDLGGAHAILAKMVKLNPDAIMFQYELAEVMRNQNDYDDAVPYYERVSRSWPQWSDPWLSLGLCYGNLGKITESHLARAQGFLVAPDLEAARQSLALARGYLRKTPNPAATEWANAIQSHLDNLK